MKDRTCITCKYRDLELFENPCLGCGTTKDGDFSEWVRNPDSLIPEWFKNKMHEIATSNILDEEDRHREMDFLMCEVLRSIGYDEGVDIFEKQCWMKRGKQ